VIVLEPALSPVAKPEALIVATSISLEPHVTASVTSTCSPELAPVANAINWLVSLSNVTVWVPGRIDREATDPVDPPKTVSVAVLAMIPPKPGVLAVIVVVPWPTPVANPVALMVATLLALDVQLAVSVIFWLVEGWLPCPMIPMAMNCTVVPAAKV